jgi:hypothetical protein
VKLNAIRPAKVKGRPVECYLARVGEFEDVDPYKYFCGRLPSLGVTGSVVVLAAAITQMGRQLAYDLTPASEIDAMVASLCVGGKL